MKNDIFFYMGIDVQISKGCSYFIIDKNAEIVDSGWAKEDTYLKTAHQQRSVALETSGGHLDNIAIGIDSPRMPLKIKREFYWNRRSNSWRPRRNNEKGHGRHCDVVVKSLKIANPQWTRLEKDCQEWMQLGFKIFEAMKDFDYVFEVFPSASYYMLNKDRDLKVKINFSGFSQGPKDMIDACVAAMTVYEFVHGRGSEVGGCDGLGTIILPRPIPETTHSELLEWPKNKQLRSLNHKTTDWHFMKKLKIEDIWNDLCDVFENETIIYSLVQKQPNRIVSFSNEGVEVMTHKSSPGSSLVPKEMFVKAVDYLIEYGKLSHSILTEDLRVMRSAFILAALSKLSYVEYERPYIFLKELSE